MWFKKLLIIISFGYFSCGITSISLAALPVEGFAEIVKITSPAVVNISTVLKSQEEEQFSGSDFALDPIIEFYRRFEKEMRPRNQKAISLGSGFLISASGLIVTNNHIVNEAEEIKVTLEGDNTKKYTAKLIGADPKTDLALLKIDADKPLPFIVMGDSNAAQVGDWVITIGNPFGFLGGSVTAGIISAKARNLNSGLDDFIQTDAAINKGNSGGPMLNMKGEVIGINTSLISTNMSGGNIGIGFAVSAATAKPVIEQLRDKGTVSRGWLGVVIQTLEEDMINALEAKDVTGVIITEVMDNSPSAQAKLHVGDVIVAYNDKQIKTAANLQKAVAETPIGSVAKLKILRDDKFMEVAVTIAKQPNAMNSGEGAAKTRDRMLSAEKAILLGMEVANINDDLRRKFNIERAQGGVLITGVKRESNAETSGLKAGDIILRIGTESIRSVIQLKGIVEKIRASKKNMLPLLILRNDVKQYIALNLIEKEKAERK